MNNQAGSQYKSVSLLNRTSILHEPEINCLQRDADYYTRKYEQEKRKLLLIQESHEQLKTELTLKRNMVEKLSVGLRQRGKNIVNAQKIKQTGKQLE